MMAREVLIVLSCTIGLLGGRRGRERAALWWRRTIGMLHVARFPLQCMELEDVDETAPCGRVARWRMVSRFDGPRDWELLGAEALMCWAVRVASRRRCVATEEKLCHSRSRRRTRYVCIGVDIGHRADYSMLDGWVDGIADAAVHVRVGVRRGLMISSIALHGRRDVRNNAGGS